jgi:predicted DCC family thiol-disulfide oxidoreductase YuxK
MARAPGAGLIVLYDGVCALCNRLVRFLLARDRAGRLRFASLQSGFARELLARHGHDAGRLAASYLVLDAGTPAERVVGGARGVLLALAALGGPWRLARWLGVLPSALLDAVYGVVARNRYRWFGRYDRCLLPPPDVRDRFLDV